MNRLSRISEQELSSSQKKIVLLCFFCSLTILMAIFSGPHGQFIIDEGTYHLMARSFAESGNLAVWNGYEEFPSAELVLHFTRVYEGRLVPQYPYLSAVLNYPFYRLAGFEGLIILNAIAFAGTVGLCFRIALTLFRDTALALNACLILVFATFSWEYSQAAWPHAVSMLFVTASAYFAVAALMSPRPRASLALALAGGAVAGFGAGIRLDVIFVLPALAVPFIFVRPWRPWCALAACLGTVPGLAVLAATNYAKFGVFSAFAYAPNVSGGAVDPRSYLTIVLFGLAFLAAAWVISRHRSSVNARRGRWLLLAGLVALTGIILLVPTLQSLVSRMANGLFQLLVDLRVRDLDYAHGGLTRSPGGGLIYIGGLKKALLQSCPYLVMLAVPMAMLLRGAKDGLSLGALLLTPAAFVAAYAYFAWDGGQSLNLRYFTPILPFTSVLAAFAWREITRDLPASRRRLAIVVGGAAGALYGAFIIIGPIALWGPMTIERQEIVFLTLPLVIAVLALAFVLAQMIKPGEAARSAASASLAVALVWSGMVAFTHDYPQAYGVRKARGAFSQTLARVIQADSVVLTINPHLFYGLPDHLRVRIAQPWQDDFQGLRPLVEFYLDRGQAVYAWMTEAMEQTVRERRLFDAFAVVPLHEHRWGRFVQLRRPQEKPGADSAVDRLLTPPAAAPQAAPEAAPEAAREARGRPGLGDQ